MSNLTKQALENKDAVLKSEICGCYYCMDVFRSNKVSYFEKDDTAFCPRCGIDSVVPYVVELHGDIDDFIDALEVQHHLSFAE